MTSDFDALWASVAEPLENAAFGQQVSFPTADKLFTVAVTRGTGDDINGHGIMVYYMIRIRKEQQGSIRKGHTVNYNDASYQVIDIRPAGSYQEIYFS